MTTAAAPPGLPGKRIREALRLSTIDGALASVFGALTGGVFLTGFALRLSANEVLIGLLAALPLVATVAQLSGAYLIERVGRRRAVCIAGAAASRLLWLFALALPLLAPAAPGEGALAAWLLLAVAGLSALLGSLGGVAWLSWMADLVPIGVRGRYFGSRNLVCGVTSMLATLAGGWYLDRFAPVGPPWGFATLFALAVAAGWGSVHYLRRIPDPVVPAEPPGREPFLRLVWLPLREPNFRRLVRFSLLWNGAVNFAAPFITVYMLETLKVSYVQVASLATLSTVAHLVTIRGWGRFADQFGNRPVMLVTGALAVPVPLLWLFVTPANFGWLAPAIHVLAGAAWAGHGLAGGNLLLRLAPRVHNAVYLSTFAALSGIGSAVGPVLAGLLALALRDRAVELGPFALDRFGFIFACSFAGRLLTLPLLRRVEEPRRASVREVIRVLRTIRGVNSLMGVDTLVQFVMVTIRGRPPGGPRAARRVALRPAPSREYTTGPAEAVGRWTREAG
ncbi:MAG TPA: MFS transporter, partial [Thermodesulfobacteriota bacterium]|nr:MFS transporter [Thermodesulfobacteriota bacterium]